MSSSVPTIEATGEEEPAPLDGWRNGGLPALRSELDRIDDAIHDLLIQRAEVVEYVARSGKPAALVRIWRELLAGTTSMQGGFSLAVCDSGAGGPLIQLAREHFGALTPLRASASAEQTLADVSEGVASVAVLPYPSGDDTWWISLLHHEPRLHIIARLPFWKPRPEGFSSAQAVVVGAAPPDASESDRTFLGLECDRDVSRTRLSSELAVSGLKAETMVLVRDQGSAKALVEVEGSLSDDDERLSHLGSVLRRPVVLGSYAVPIAGVGR